MKLMKRKLIGVFAHPDDESFGPSGTLLKLVRDGVELHLICVTDGSQGENPDAHPDLAAIRLTEWQEAAGLIGATSAVNLGYRDGTLCNRKFHKITTQLQREVQRIIRGGAEPVELSFMTFDPNGISGHIDHITVSMATSFVYTALRQSDDPLVSIGDLLYFCVSEHDFPAPSIPYVFMPAGRPAALIDITEDIHSVADEKRHIMCAHRSQRDDAAVLLSREATLSREHFFVLR